MSVIELDKVGKSSNDAHKESEGDDIVKNSRSGKKLATGTNNLIFWYKIGAKNEI